MAGKTLITVGLRDMGAWLLLATKRFELEVGRPDELRKKGSGDAVVLYFPKKNLLCS